jgi:hypothetical protein
MMQSKAILRGKLMALNNDLSKEELTTLQSARGRDQEG